MRLFLSRQRFSRRFMPEYAIFAARHAVSLRYAGALADI